MCDGNPAAKSQAPANLHEKLCHATHGIPCHVAHSFGDFLKRLIGRGPSGATACGCSAHAAAPAQTESSCGCSSHTQAAEATPTTAPAKEKCGGHGAKRGGGCGCAH